MALPPKRIEGQLAYKCRRCGSTFAFRIPDMLRAIEELMETGKTRSWGQMFFLVHRHECEDFGFPAIGLADCIGVHGMPHTTGEPS